MLRNWTVTATYSGGTRTLSPIADNVIIDDTPEKDAPLLYARSLGSDLVLAGADFDWLRAIDQAGCDEVTIETERDGFTLSGIINLKSLNFEDDRCTVSLTYDEEQPYQCLIDREDEEVDVLRTINPTKYTIRATIGDLETYTCPIVLGYTFETGRYSEATDACSPPDAIGWVVTSRYISDIVDNGDDTSTGNVKLSFARLVFDDGTVPPGDGWTLVSGTKYARSPAVTITELNVVIDSDVSYKASVFSGSTVIDNAFKLNDVIDYFVTQCGLTWSSVFLGKNAPTTPDPGTYDATVYDWAYENAHQLMLVQKSDVKRFDDAQNASKAPIKWANILELMRILNLRWTYKIDELVIEHVSYFSASNGLDLTVPPYSKYLEGLKFYEGRGNDLAGKSVFVWMDQTNIAFDGVPIAYPCGDQSKVESYPAEVFTTNLEAMLGDPSNIDDLGFALLSTFSYSGGFALINTANILVPTSSPINGALSFPNIHAVLWLHDANYPEGNLNEDDITFISTKPQRKTSAEVLIKWDVYKVFNPANLVTCSYGDWSVAKASYSDIDGSLSLDLEG